MLLYLSVIALAIFFLIRWCIGGRGLTRIQSVERKVVVITGCDSGVGYAAAEEAHRYGFVVVAGCLKEDGEGAVSLRKNDERTMIVVKCDIRKREDLDELHRVTSKIIKDNEYTLHAIVSNAGVLVFGEFQWQTEEQLFNQIEVNTTGHIRFLKRFLPEIIRSKGRIISVSSTCGSWVLPGLSLYAASKYAAEAICRGIRVETKRFGVKVININPGELADQTNILAAQGCHAEEMKPNVLPGDEEYFEYFQRHLTNNFKKQPHNAVNRSGVLKIILESLVVENPKNYYSDATIVFRLMLFVYKMLPDDAADGLLRSIMKKQIGYDPEAKKVL